jgi:hypothetical protein
MPDERTAMVMLTPRGAARSSLHPGHGSELSSARGQGSYCHPSSPCALRARPAHYPPLSKRGIAPVATKSEDCAGAGCMDYADELEEREGGDDELSEIHALILFALPPCCALCFILGLAVGLAFCG